MQIEDISVSALEETIKKWSEVLENGWHGGIWTKCSVCNEVSVCEDCALYPERWCTGDAETSRLHPKFHNGNKAAWKGDLEAYIKRINTVLNKKGILEKTGEKSC